MCVCVVEGVQTRSMTKRRWKGDIGARGKRVQKTFKGRVELATLVRSRAVYIARKLSIMQFLSIEYRDLR